MSATVILAAGQGSRLGGTGKALIRLDGRTLAERAVQTVIAAGSRPVLVLGHDSGEVISVLQRDAPVLMSNVEQVIVEPHQGQWLMRDSFCAGIDCAAKMGEEQVAIVLVDQPGVDSAVLGTLLQAHQPGWITRASVDGAPTHPVVFDLDEAIAAAGLNTCGEHRNPTASAQGRKQDQGARSYLQEHHHRIATVDMSGRLDSRDIDTPADLEAARQEAAHRGNIRGR